MQHRTAVEVENNMARAMLIESINNQAIQRALTEVAQSLLQAVVSPLRIELSKITHYSELNKECQEILLDIAAEHSAEKRQCGALIPHVESSKEILNSKENILKLLDEHERVLGNISNAKTIEDMLIVLKTIVELGFCYFAEAPANWRSANFDKLKLFISPSTEETDSRIYRNEIGQENKLALTFGIGTEETDLALKSAGIGGSSGKSVFAKVEMHTRLQRLCDQYDANPTETKFIDKMNFYKIPLDKNLREPLNVYAARWQTCFEKATKTKNLPLIASVSWATTRVLVSLQDLNAFNKSDGTFDFDKAQIIANCMMGFIVHAGHHSTVEVAEVYNRLLDYIGIQQLEQHGSRQRALPYYQPGSYKTFFHQSIAERVNAETNDARPSFPKH